jgi:hypothetical protein
MISANKMIGNYWLKGYELTQTIGIILTQLFIGSVTLIVLINSLRRQSE